jgi:hypothetical protein
MCPSTPDIPEPIVYAQPTDEVVKAPVMKDTARTSQATTTKAKARGTRNLRTDLGIADTNSGNKASALGIPGR